MIEENENKEINPHPYTTLQSRIPEPLYPTNLLPQHMEHEIKLTKEIFATSRIDEDKQVPPFTPGTQAVPHQHSSYSLLTA